MSTVNRLGIDLSSDHLDLFLAGPDGRPLMPARRFEHNGPGSQAAREAVIAACRRHPAEQLVIGAEATGLLWWHLYHQWAADPQLAELHPVFYLLNPAPVHGFRRAVPPQDKTDQVDPRLIVQYLSVPGLALQPWVNQLEQWPLRFLTRYRCHLAHTLGAYKSYARTWIYLLASAYESCKPFGDLFGKTSLEILTQYPTLDSLAEMPTAELAEQLDVLGKRRFPDPTDNARRLQQAARHSYPLDPAVREAVHFILGQVIDVIRFLDKRLAMANAFIATRVKEDADVHNLDTIGGLGPVYSAGLAAEIRPTQRFLTGTKFDHQRGCERPRTLADGEASVAKLAGLWWPRSASGHFEAQDRRMSKAGNAYLRYYLIEAANHVRGHVPEYGDFYQRKYAEATKHHHQRALVLTARKLVRLVFVLLHKHEAYRSGGTAQAT